METSDNALERQLHVGYLFKNMLDRQNLLKSEMLSCTSSLNSQMKPLDHSEGGFACKRLQCLCLLSKKENQKQQKYSEIQDLQNSNTSEIIG